MVINASSSNIQDQYWYFDILIPDEPILFNAERKKDNHRDESYTKAQKLRWRRRRWLRKRKKSKKKYARSTLFISYIMCTLRKVKNIKQWFNTYMFRYFVCVPIFCVCLEGCALESTWICVFNRKGNKCLYTYTDKNSPCTKDCCFTEIDSSLATFSASCATLPWYREFNQDENGIIK